MSLYIHSYNFGKSLILLHSERPKLHTILAFLSAIGLMNAGYNSGPSTVP